MSPTHFKLSKQNGLMRRISFESRPNWLSLASRIVALYDIPVEKVGVSYIDSDGDEVTLSSDEELKDFYNGLRNISEAVRFAVQDLRTLRESQDLAPKALPETPHTTNPRNTFGGMEGLMFDMDDDWQRLPTGLFRQESPHAFVEVVNSDASSVSKIDRFDTTSSVGSNLDGVAQGQQKGKGRAYQASDTESISSTGSVLAEHVSAKHPVHVYDISVHSQSRASTPEVTVRSAASRHSTAVPIVAESTPKATLQALDDADPSAPKSSPIANEAVPDPPLPTFDSPPAPSTASLSNDVASLLSTLTNVVSSHPELSEGVRNIIRNTTSGMYWSAHREAMSRAAEEIAHARDETGRAVQGLTRTAEEIRRNAEQEAGRRVTEALGGIFRAFSASGGATSGATHAAPHQSMNWPDFSGNRDRGSPGPPPSFHSHWSQRPHGWHPDSWGGRPRPPFGQSPWRSSWSHPPPPQSPFVPPGFAGMPPPGLPPHAQAPPPQMHPPPPGPPPPPHGPLPPLHASAPPPHAPPTPHGLPFGPHGPPPAVWHWSDPSPPKPTSQELRAQVELAKYNYKTEKERYRKERDERRKERERTHGETNVAEGLKKFEDEAPPPTAQIVSNARGPYPQLEMVSVPHRHNTYSGPPTRRNAVEGTEGRAVQRISRRLADMGFTENAYPSIPTKIKTQMPPAGIVNKDSEDDIVTTLLEELLSMSPKPGASGSGLRRDRDIPGAWH